MRTWFAANGSHGWITCPLTESGFVRVSANPSVLPVALGIEEARSVLVALRAVEGHRFVADDVSLADADVPNVRGHRQVTDAHLVTLARRVGTRLVTFDAGVHAFADGHGVELLSR
jgi:toxin-antitoxin system PIN domain toxin